jgi:heme-degrading monooxygenase HmoA
MFADIQKGRTKMYARVLTAQAKPGQSDELIRIIGGSVVASVKKELGFKGFLLLHERATGKGISITLWENPVDLKASETSGYLRHQLDTIDSLLTDPPVVGVYEVSIQV